MNRFDMTRAVVAASGQYAANVACRSWPRCTGTGLCLRSSKLLLLLSVFFRLALLQTEAADSAAFEEVNKLYEEGRYRDAIQGYQALLTNRPCVAVHFNLGNAYFKSGQLGEAIAQYLEAEDLAPRDPDVLANLRFARQRVDGPSYEASWIRRQTRVLTPGEWAALSTAVVWVFFGLLLVRQLQPRWGSALRTWTIVAGGLAAILSAAAIWIWQMRAGTQVAVANKKEVIMRLGPFEESQSALALKDGAELRILDQKDGWLQVTPGDNQIGWVQTNAVKVPFRH